MLGIGAMFMIAFAAFLFIRMSVKDLVAASAEIENLVQTAAQLDAILVSSGQFIQTDPITQKNVEALIANMEKDNPEIAKQARKIYDGMFAKMNAGLVDGSIQGFSSEISELSSRFKKQEKDKRAEFEENITGGFLKSSLFLLAILAVFAYIIYDEKRRSETAFAEVVGYIDRFARYIDYEANRFDRLPQSAGAKGKLARAFNDLADRVELIRDENLKTLGEFLIISAKISKGQLTGKFGGDFNNYNNRRLAITFNKMAQNLYQNLDLAIGALENLLRGDFTARIEASGEGEFKRLFDGVNSLSFALVKSRSLNLKYASMLNSAAKELTSAVESLGEVSASQAKSVEEITASVREIIQKIGENTTKAEQMATFAIETKEAASSGLSLTQGTVRAMEEIGESTSQIRDAIAVIDSISFQTNILSLNAAVEAATAGEAGKGFAVVAGEVRTLAGKSAEAAKKIKELVTQTQSKSQEGISISKQMISSFDLLARKIAETSDLVNAVTIASQEEMKKAGVISKTIEELDAINRQNSEAAARTGDFAKSLLSLADKMSISATAFRES
jgi:methyl-accepting chemotaxis protein